MYNGPWPSHWAQIPEVYRQEWNARRKQGAPLWECSALWAIVSAWWRGWEFVGAQGGLTYSPQERRGNRWQ